MSTKLDSQQEDASQSSRSHPSSAAILLPVIASYSSSDGLIRSRGVLNVSALIKLVKTGERHSHLFELGHISTE